MDLYKDAIEQYRGEITHLFSQHPEFNNPVFNAKFQHVPVAQFGICAGAGLAWIRLYLAQ